MKKTSAEYRRWTRKHGDRIAAAEAKLMERARKLAGRG